ncbi:MAG: discoidin domain-containing protein [Clostridium sp.]|nr:discoidin domain-containing protein [Clostridium sp.]
MRKFYVFMLMMLISSWAKIPCLMAATNTPEDGMICHIKYGSLYLTLSGSGTGNDDDRTVVLTDAASEKSLWKLEKSGEAAGSFIIRNVFSNNSLGIQQVGLTLVTAEGNYPYTIAGGTDGYSIYSETAFVWGDESTNGQFYMSGSGVEAGNKVIGSREVDAGWTFDELKYVSKGARVTARNQLATGSKVVIRNAGSNSARTGFVYESGTNLLIDNGATTLKGLSYDYVFTLTDYNSSNGTGYLTANSGRKVAGDYTDTSAPMQTVDTPEGKITLITEGTYKWDLQYGEGNFFNNQSNTAYGPFVNTWTSQGDGNASWEIYVVDEDLIFEPVAGSAYYIDCLVNNNGRVAYLPGANCLLQTPDNQNLHLGNLFAMEAVEGEFGETYYRINLYADGNSHVYYSNTNDANGNVCITTDADNANLNWSLLKSTASAGGFNIIPETGRNGWNFRGTESVWNMGGLGQWNGNDQNTNSWNIVAVSAEEVEQAVASYKTAVAPCMLFDVVGGMPAEARVEYNNRVSALTELADIFNAPTAIPSQLQQEGYALIKPQSTSGLFKIKNKILDKYLFQETDEKNIAFINDGGDNGKYYFKVTFSEDNNLATIVSSSGKPLGRGNQSAAYANATTEVVSPVSMEYCGNEGYFLFPRSHSTAQATFTKNNAAYNTETNPYFLTSWTATGASNQYTFEPVELPDAAQIYTVVYEGEDELAFGAKTIYTGAGYAGNATVYNGGFYILSAVPQASDFEVTEYDTDLFDARVTVEGNTVKVTFEEDAERVANYLKWEELRAEILNQTQMTPSVMTDMSGMTYSTNAQQTNDGALANSGCLNDNNTSTFFHSSYNTTNGTDPGTYHYLQIDLGDAGHTFFSFETTKRMGNSNNRPTEMEVQASVDGESFTTLYTLEGIPVANDVFRSPLYPLNNGQRYLRFVVKKTNNDAMLGNYPFFTYSEFHINTTDGVLPAALAQSSLAADKAALDAAFSAFDVNVDYASILNSLQSARQQAQEFSAAYVSFRNRMEATKNYMALEGEGVGHYTCTNKNEQQEAYATVAAAVEEGAYSNLDNYTDAAAFATLKAQAEALSWQLNEVAKGLVYLIRSAVPDNERYMQSAATGNPQMVAWTDGDYSQEKACLLLYKEDGTLVPVYGEGQVRIDQGTTFAFAEHATQMGKYNLRATNAGQKYAYNATGSAVMDQFETNETHLNAVNSAWTVEPVESYTVTLREVEPGTNWATFYTDKPVYMPEGMQARYVGTDANATETEQKGVFKLVYTNIEDENNILPSETGVLLVGAESGNQTLCVSRMESGVATPSDNHLVGSTVDGALDAQTNLYALSKPAGYSAGFYCWTGSNTPAHKAFLQMDFTTADEAALGFLLVEGGDATGVTTVEATAVESDGVCYDLTGKRVVNPTQRGVYIKNGKKLVIK